MKKLIFITLFMLIFSLPVCAETPYFEQFEKSGVDEIFSLADDQTKAIIDRLDLDISSPDWVSSLTPKSVFGEVITLLKEGAKTPLKCGAVALAIILLTAAASTFDVLRPGADTVQYVFLLTISATLVLPLFSVISVCTSAIKSLSSLLLGFIPIYAGLLVASGQPTVAAGANFLLLTAANAVGGIGSLFISPLMSCYLGASLAGSLVPSVGTARVGESIKKISMWVLSLVSTIFIGILSAQTAVNRAADGVGVKAARFMIGSFVPTLGGALSESLTTLIGSIKLLKTSAVIFAAVIICFTVLPITIEILIWRATVFVLIAAGELFGVGRCLEILRAADCVLSILMGLLLFLGALFIISLAIISGG